MTLNNSEIIPEMQLHFYMTFLLSSTSCLLKLPNSYGTRNLYENTDEPYAALQKKTFKSEFRGLTCKRKFENKMKYCRLP